MDHMTRTATYVGRRVQWLGDPQRGYVTDSYRRALAAGDRRLPTPDEQLTLSTGDQGIVTKLLETHDDLGHNYVIRFANGYEIETALPAERLVSLLDDDVHTTRPVEPRTAAQTRPHRYAPHRSAASSGVGRILRGLLNRTQPER